MVFPFILAIRPSFLRRIETKKDKELKTLVREVSSSNLRNTVEFNEFLQLMSKKLKNDGCEEELLEAFRWVA